MGVIEKLFVELKLQNMMFKADLGGGAHIHRIQTPSQVGLTGFISDHEAIFLGEEKFLKIKKDFTVFGT